MTLAGITAQAIDANIKRIFGKTEAKQVSIDDWIGKYADRRQVTFKPVADVYLNDSNGMPVKCEVTQHSIGYIAAEAYGNTTAEAFWAAIEQFQRITGGIYRSGK